MVQKTNWSLRISDSRRKKLWRSIRDWYRDKQRELPWRKTRDPYRIFVSEIMLQQTQVNHVIGKYREFLRRFPTVRSLAFARTSDVIRAWSGLGYNMRAVRLLRVAQEVVERFGGKIPSGPELLLQLPGIGQYTANAIASFAFELSVPVVDTNIRRVISRLFFSMRYCDERVSEQSAWKIAGELLPRTRPRDWTLALMDLGSTICTGSRPRCSECPVNRLCRSSFLLDGKRITRHRLKMEPSHEGIPNRLYRGRIVEVLRSLNGSRPVSLRKLGTKIKTPFRRSDEDWLRGILDDLQRDGLVKVVGRSPDSICISLP